MPPVDVLADPILSLFRRSVNITLGPKEDRVLITGLHTVADVYCNSCQTILGWKYVSRAPLSLLSPPSAPSKPSASFNSWAFYLLLCCRSRHSKRAKSTRRESASSKRPKCRQMSDTHSSRSARHKSPGVCNRRVIGGW